MGVVSLVVMEPGSEWPGHVGDFEHVVAVGDEGGLLRRTQQGLDSLRRRGLTARVAVLACNESTTRVAVRQRAQVAHEMLGAVGAVPFGRMVLSSAATAPMEARRELVSLAGDLSARLTGSSATVSVIFTGSGEALRHCAGPAPELRPLWSNALARGALPGLADTRGWGDPSDRLRDRRDPSAASGG